ncbi:hypothetical protein AGOR_G00121640 [Albula goreensis]|uniref:Protein phosphatase 1 regulatory subunit 37 n=1 Tax=Albula goreensis TaxID=1534307 RepID=A0A8T3DCE4_9TELE|nr:hypothetical protein AGOR_G00121640 [Albula goreensis]
MNSEEEILDFCNAKTKKNVNEDTTNRTEEIIPRNSLQVMDGDVGKPCIETEAMSTTMLAGRNDRPGAEEARVGDCVVTDKLNGNSGVPCASQIAASDLDITSSDQHRRGESDPNVGTRECSFSVGDIVIGGVKDVGVDLTLDNSGLLEPLAQEGDESGDKIVPDVSSLSTEGSAMGTDTHVSEKPLKNEASFESPKGEASSPASALDENDKHKQGGKRVTFPSDEDIVSGAVEPKDPWRHAQNVTVDEILSAYKQACQKLNCKPIARLLTQIQELKELSQRNECLDLKGEKLDYRACEALEEVFKRVQFKVVDLEQTNLDEDGASALFDMIEYYESATHLNISFNKHIGTRGWQAAAHMMRKTSSLTYLDARNTPLLDHSAPFVARALRISGSLAVLHLENAGLTGRPLMLLATALKMNMNLKELYLADNKLNGLQDSAQLGNLLKFNYNIQILDLRNNHIMDSGLAYVCEGLKEQRKGLVTLVLWNNQLTHNGMGYLAAALPCTQSLETLNLGHNSVGNEGVHKLKDGLIANRSVLRLGLASTKLSCEGAVAVAEFIAESPRLLRLDLRENEIKTGGLMALSLALKVNTSLLRLDLDREPKRETVKSFIETQRALLAEIQNGCKRNFILAKEKEETEQKMRLSASMPEITAAPEEGEREEQETASSGPAGGDAEGDQPVGGGEGAEEPTQNQAGESAQSPGSIVLVDSDTDEEEEDDVVEGAVTSVGALPPAPHPSVSAPPTPPPAAPASPLGPAIVSGITVSETPVPPGTPPSPGRCISVSSPGRGHKIFMVTRVESPPEKQQLKLPEKREMEKQQETGLPSATPQKEPAPEVHQTPTKPAPSPVRPCDKPHQEVTAVKQPLSPAVQEGAGPQQAVQEREQSHRNTQPPQVEQELFQASKQSLQVGEDPLQANTVKPQIDQTLFQTNKKVPQVEQEKSQPNTEPPQTEQDLLQLNTEKQQKGQTYNDGLQVEQEQPQINTTELKIDQTLSQAKSEELQKELSQKNTDEDTLGMELEQSQESRKDPQAEQELSQANTEVLHEQGELNEQEVQPQKEQQPSSGEEEEEQLDQPGTLLEGLETDCCAAVTGADGSGGESEGGAVASSLPNGLKPEFALHLPDPEGPKPGSCSTEHVSVSAELSCGQDLEELLREASVETGREAP